MHEAAENQDSARNAETFKSPASTLLQISHLSKSFAALVAVDDVSLSIQRGSITALIGPNGAGKSTLFDAIVGESTPDTGSIHFDGKPVHNQTPEQIFKHGLARTFQIPQPFPEMTVLDNLMLAAPGQLGETVWAPLLRPAAIRRQETANLERAREILSFTTLEQVSEIAAGNLSGGQQKLLELARVLIGNPSMILLDEPAAGVNPTLTEVLIDKIHALNERGITFLIIEHNMDLIMSHCDPIIAMSNGKVIFEGTSEEALGCTELLDSYLGDVGQHLP